MLAPGDCQLKGIPKSLLERKEKENPAVKKKSVQNDERGGRIRGEFKIRRGRASLVDNLRARMELRFTRRGESNYE